MAARLVALLTVLMGDLRIDHSGPDTALHHVRIEIPDERGNKTREISTPEGKATAAVQEGSRFQVG